MNLSSLLEQLKEFSGKQNMNEEKFNLNNELYDFYENIVPGFEDYDKANFSVQYHPYDLFVFMDRFAYKRVLQNLVENALHKITGFPEEKSINIGIRTYLETGHAVTEVSDDGEPIPEENKRKIFEPFYTTKERGSGLGLATCKKIVAEVDGKIEAPEGFLDRAVFRVYVPLASA